MSSECRLCNEFVFVAPGKASIVRYLAAQAGASLDEITLTEGIDATELLGGYEPFVASTVYIQIEELVKETWAFLLILLLKGVCPKEAEYLTDLSVIGIVTPENVAAIKLWATRVEPLISTSCELPTQVTNKAARNFSALKRVLRRVPKVDLSSSADNGASAAAPPVSFQWTDGQLLTSVQKGGWLLVRHVHLASAAVLDRLNSLLEPNGSILLTECGSSEVIKPHPNFRILFTSASTTDVDVKLSKPLRNRCLEIFIGSRLPRMTMPPDQLKCISHSVDLSHVDLAYLVEKLFSNLSAPPIQSSDITSHLFNMMQLSTKLATSSGESFPLLESLIDAYRVAQSLPHSHFLSQDSRLAIACMHSLSGLIRWCVSRIPCRMHFVQLLTVTAQKSQSGTDVSLSDLISNCKASFDSRSGCVTAESIHSHLFHSNKSPSLRDLAQWTMSLCISSATEIRFHPVDAAWESFQTYYLSVSQTDTTTAVVTTEVLAFFKALLCRVFSLSVEHASDWSRVRTAIAVGSGEGSCVVPNPVVSSKVWSETMLLRFLLLSVPTDFRFSASSDACLLRRRTTSNLCESTVLFLENFAAATWSDQLDGLARIVETSDADPFFSSTLSMCISNVQSSKKLFLQIEQDLRETTSRCLESMNIWRVSDGEEYLPANGEDNGSIQVNQLAQSQCNKTIDNVACPTSSSPISHAAAVVNWLNCMSLPDDINVDVLRLKELIAILRCWIRLCFRVQATVVPHHFKYSNVQRLKAEENLSDPPLIAVHRMGPISLWDIRTIVDHCPSNRLAEMLKACHVNLDGISLSPEISAVPGPSHVTNLMRAISSLSIQRLCADAASLSSLLRFLSSVLSVVAIQQDQICCVCDMSLGLHYRQGIITWLKQLPTQQVYQDMIQLLSVVQNTIRGLSDVVSILAEFIQSDPSQHCNPNSDVIARIGVREPFMSASEFLLTCVLTATGCISITTDSLDDLVDLLGTLRSINTVRRRKCAAHCEMLVSVLWKRVSPLCLPLKSSELSRRLDEVTGSDLFIILHLAHLLKALGHSFLRYNIVLPHLVVLRAQIKFSQRHIKSVISYMKDVGRQTVAPFLLQALASCTAVMHCLDARTDSQSHTALIEDEQKICSFAGRECLILSQNLFSVIFSNNGVKFVQPINSLMSVDSNYAATLMMGEVSSKPFVMSSAGRQPVDVERCGPLLGLNLFAVDELLDWRSCLALNFCNVLATDLTIGSLNEAKSSAIFLQQLHSGYPDIDSAMWNFSAPAPSDSTSDETQVCPTIGISEDRIRVIGKWVEISDWLKILLPLICPVKLASSSINKKMDDFINLIFPQRLSGQMMQCHAHNVIAFFNDIIEHLISLKSCDFCNSSAKSTIACILSFLSCREQEMNVSDVDTLEDTTANTLMALIGCWAVEAARMHGGEAASLSNRLSCFAVEASKEKENLFQYANFRRVAALLERGNGLTADVARLQAEAKSFGEIHAALSQKLPLRSTLDLNRTDGIGTDDKAVVLQVLRDVDVVRDGNASLESLISEIKEFLGSFWNMNQLARDFSLIARAREGQITNWISATGVDICVPIEDAEDLTKAVTAVTFLFHSTAGFLRQQQEAYLLHPDMLEGLAFCCNTALTGLVLNINSSIQRLSNFKTGAEMNMMDGQSDDTMSHDIMQLPGLISYSSRHPSEKLSTDKRLWLLQWVEWFAQQHVLTSPMTYLLELLTNLHELSLCLWEDQKREEELNALKFAKYIQDQEHGGPDKEEEDDACAAQFFPMGQFTSEEVYSDQFEGNTAEIEPDPVAFELTQVIPAQLPPSRKIEAASAPHFNSSHVQRFTDIVRQIFARLYQNQQPCGRTNGGVGRSSMEPFPPELLTAALGFELTNNNFYSRPSPKKSPLVSNLLRQYTHLLDAATTSELSHKFSALFEGEDHLLMEDIDDEPPPDATDEQLAEAARQEVARYQSQKVKFVHVQRLLKSVKCQVSHDKQNALSFYSEAWPAACVVAYPAVSAIHTKTVELLRSFENHPALVKILELTEIIMKLPVFRTTTISLVNALELLLGRCHRWEPFAHRGVSLFQQIQTLRQVVLLFRHQQLDDWRRLRDTREEHEAARTAVWLPELFLMAECLVGAGDDDSLTATRTGDSFKEQTQSLWTYLENNVLAKSLGQFDSRLQIIYGLGLLYQADSRRAVVGNILVHFAAYLTLSRHKVHVALNKGRRVMDKEVHGLLKVTRWDFSRYTAEVQESLRRSHRQLGKCIRRFDSYIQEPVIQHVSKSGGQSPSGAEALKRAILRGALFDPDKPTLSSLFISCLEPILGGPVSSARARVSFRCAGERGVSSWVQELCRDVEAALSAVEMTTSTYKRRWVSDLKASLAENLQLRPLTRQADIWMVTSSVGLPGVLGVQCLLLNKHTQGSGDDNNILGEMTSQWQNATLIDICRACSMMPDCWQFGISSFYKLLRRYTALTSDLERCHDDMKIDRNYDVWIGLLSALLEHQQKRLDDVWQFGCKMSTLIDYVALLSVPSYGVETSTLVNLLETVDRTQSHLSQVRVFIGTTDTTSVALKPDLHTTRTAQELQQTEKRLTEILNSIQSLLSDLQTCLLACPEIRLFRSKSISIPRITGKVGTLLEDKLEALLSRDAAFTKTFYSLPTIPIQIRHIIATSLSQTVEAISSVISATNGKQAERRELDVAQIIEEIELTVNASNDTTFRVSSTVNEDDSESLGVDINTHVPLSEAFPMNRTLDKFRTYIDNLGQSPVVPGTADQLKRVVELGVAVVVTGLDNVTGLGSLGLMLSKVTEVLLKTGYCGEKDKEVEQKTKDEWRAGTGMGEGEGVRDISNEIENEDMMDGYKDEEQHQKEHEEPESKDAMNTSMDIDQEMTTTKQEDPAEDDERPTDESERVMDDVDLDDGGQLENNRGDGNNEEEDMVEEKEHKSEEISTKDGVPQSEVELQAKEDAVEESADIEEESRAEREDGKDDGEQSEVDEAENAEGESKDAENNVNIDKPDTAGEIAMDLEDYGIEEPNDQDDSNDAEHKEEGAADEKKQDEKKTEADADVESGPTEDCASPADDTNREEEMEQNATTDDDDVEAPSSNDKLNLEENETKAEAVEDVAAQQSKQEEQRKMKAQQGVNKDDLMTNSTMDKPDDVHQQVPSSDQADTAAADETSGLVPDDESQQKQQQKQGGSEMIEQKHHQPRAPNPIKDSIEAVEAWLKQVSLLDIKKTLDEKDEKTEEDVAEDVAADGQRSCEQDKASSMTGLAEVDQETKQTVNEIDQEQTAKVDQKDAHAMADDEDEKADDKRPLETATRDLLEKTPVDSNAENEHPTPAAPRRINPVPSTDLSLEVPISTLIHSTPDDAVDDDMIDDDDNDDDVDADRIKIGPIFTVATAGEIWNRYEVVTAGVASALCEQLRIVLEPTLRGRLHGDYRTGKRLSMRKVIAFIASNFRRDLIWLRRSKPSGRDYRVLVALDNSKSMSECGVGLKALEAVCAVCCAFQKLEIGKTGVCSFGGDRPEVIIPLKENVFDHSTGARIVSSFNFNEESAQSHDQALPALLDLAFDVFSAAGPIAFDSPVQQMLLILSDGRFNKETLRQHVHAAVTAGITPVLLIIDSCGGESGGRQSVTQMKEIKFVESKPVVTRYLEQFPFQFYAIINNAQALPAVVGDVIRQWVEMLSRK